jgi:hypothetical protein
MRRRAKKLLASHDVAVDNSAANHCKLKLLTLQHLL